MSVCPQLTDREDEEEIQKLFCFVLSVQEDEEDAQSHRDKLDNGALILPLFLEPGSCLRVNMTTQEEITVSTSSQDSPTPSTQVQDSTPSTPLQDSCTLSQELCTPFTLSQDFSIPSTPSQEPSTPSQERFTSFVQEDFTASSIPSQNSATPSQEPSTPSTPSQIPPTLSTPSQDHSTPFAHEDFTAPSTPSQDSVDYPTIRRRERPYSLMCVSMNDEIDSAPTVKRGASFISHSSGDNALVSRPHTGEYCEYNYTFHFMKS